LRALLSALGLLLAFAAAITPGVAAPRTAEEAREIDAVFLAGVATLEAGRPAAAIPVFRAILARHPDLVRVRLELGRAYFENRQWRDARREFALALSAELPETVRRNVLDFIRRIDSRRGFDWQLDLSLSRLGSARRFDSDVIELDFGGSRLPFTIERSNDSEIGLSFDLRARFSRQVTPLSGPRVATTVFAEPFAHGDYARAEALRDYTYGVRAGPRISAARTTAEVTLLAQRRDVGSHRLDTLIGAELGGEWRNGTGTSVFADVSWLDIEDHRNDARDGHAFDVSLGVSRTLGSRANLGATVFGEARRTAEPFEAYDRYGLTIFGGIEPGTGLAIDASAYTARRDFREPNVLFTDDPDETEYGATLRVEKIDVYLARRFTPYVEVRVKRVDSGIDAFSYHERALAVGIEKAF